MAILAATDFSPIADEAFRRAAEWAVRLGEPLVVTHVVHAAVGGPIEIAEGAAVLTEAARDAAGRALARAVEALRRPGLAIETRVLEGGAAAAIAEHARQIGARLVVVGTHGRRGPARLLLGSVAERIVRSAPCPVLVVPAPAEGASPRRGERLRILVGLDASAASEGAIAWVRALRAELPADLLFLHAYWPTRERERLGLEGGGAEDEREIVDVLRRELGPRIAGLPGEGTVDLRLRPVLGDEPDPLAWEAAIEGADLIVVGTRQRRDSLSGSTAIATLRAAPVPVLCVPAPPRPARTAGALPPPVRHVLAATDLSEAGNAAALRAYALVGAGGGIVELCHALPAEVRDDDRRWLEQQLEALVPAEAFARRIVTRVSLLRGPPAPAILQASERLGVDAVVLGSHGRSGIARALVGSVAVEVVRGATRPGVLVKPPREG